MNDKKMTKEEILNAFLLVNIPEIITQEEFDDVKKAIFELLKENNKNKSIINNTIDYTKSCLEHLCSIDELEILNKLEYNIIAE